MITLLLIALTALISISAFYNRSQFEKLAFTPVEIREPRDWYRFISHGFIHADWGHLILNMFVLFSFGPHVESVIEMKKGPELNTFFYLVLYIAGMVAASVPAFYKHRENGYYRAVGASGAIASLLFFFIVFNPMTKIGIIFLPVRLPAFLFGLLYLAYEYFMDKRAQGNVAHDAHFWGAMFGILYAIVLHPPAIRDFIEQVSNFSF